MGRRTTPNISPLIINSEDLGDVYVQFSWAVMRTLNLQVEKGQQATEHALQVDSSNLKLGCSP